MTKLNDALAHFQHKTPDQIAEIVKRNKIKGRMGTTYGCPMALLLDHTSTGSFVIGRKYIVRRSGKVIEKVRTPENIATFVRKFDIGGYPDMVAPPPRCLAPRGRERKRGPDPRTDRKRKPRTVQNHIGKLVGRFHEEAK